MLRIVADDKFSRETVLPMPKRSNVPARGDVILHDRREYLRLRVVEPVTVSSLSMFLNRGHARVEIRGQLNTAATPCHNNASKGSSAQAFDSCGASDHCALRRGPLNLLRCGP